MLRTVFIGLLFLTFPIVGGLVVYSSYGMLSEVNATRDWPSVQGNLLSSELAEEVGYSRSGPSNSRRKPITTYSLQVKYEYTVDGTNYQGDKVALTDDSTSDRRYAELQQEKFPTGPVNVYYDPAEPQKAILEPGNTGSIIPGMVIGTLIMIVPPLLIAVGLRYEFIERPELPLFVRMWLNPAGKGTSTETVLVDQVVDESESKPTGGSTAELPPPESDFYESIDLWEPQNRIELAFRPPAAWMYLLLAIAAGAVVAWAGMLPITRLVYQREVPHIPEVRSIAAMLFVVSGSLVFVVTRLIDRGSKTELDWNTRTVVQRRDFSIPARYNISDVQEVQVRCVAVEGKRRKYRAAIDLEFTGERVTIARTCEPRRKVESAKEKAAALADPIAKALNVPVNFVDWDESN